jgi:hypothetical protein
MYSTLFVNVTMYPHPAQQLREKIKLKKKKKNKYSTLPCNAKAACHMHQGV